MALRERYVAVHKYAQLGSKRSFSFFVAYFSILWFDWRQIKMKIPTSTSEGAVRVDVKMHNRQTITNTNNREREMSCGFAWQPMRGAAAGWENSISKFVFFVYVSPSIGYFHLYFIIQLNTDEIWRKFNPRNVGSTWTHSIFSMESGNVLNEGQ